MFTKNKSIQTPGEIKKMLSGTYFTELESLFESLIPRQWRISVMFWILTIQKRFHHQNHWVHDCSTDSTISSILEEIGADQFFSVVTDNEASMKATWREIMRQHPEISSRFFNPLIKDIINPQSKMIHFINNHSFHQQSSHLLIENWWKAKRSLHIKKTFYLSSNTILQRVHICKKPSWREICSKLATWRAPVHRRTLSKS